MRASVQRVLIKNSPSSIGVGRIALAIQALILGGVLVTLLAGPAAAWGWGEGKRRPSRGGGDSVQAQPLPASGLKTPDLPYDIAVLPLTGRAGGKAAVSLENHVVKLLTAHGLRVAPRDKVQSALHRLGLTPSSPVESQERTSLASLVGCRFLFLGSVQQRRVKRGLGGGQLLMSAGQLVVGGYLLKQKNLLTSLNVSAGLASGALVLGVAVTGVSLTATAEVQTEAYDAAEQKTVWQSSGRGNASKQFLALFSSRDRLAQQAIKGALERAVNPPPQSGSVFPIAPWASLSEEWMKDDEDGF